MVLITELLQSRYEEQYMCLTAVQDTRLNSPIGKFLLDFVTLIMKPSNIVGVHLRVGYGSEPQVL